MSAWAWFGLLDEGDLLFVCGSLAVALALLAVEMIFVALRERSIRGYLGNGAATDDPGD